MNPKTALSNQPALRHGLSTRIIASSVVALVVVLSMISWTLWLSWQMEGAGAAINDAGSHLELATRQALALAEGDLEHESLQRSSFGSLGASLQTAVQTLAESMHERENFRERMAHEATHDGLTQLPNRTASLNQLKRG